MILLLAFSSLFNPGTFLEKLLEKKACPTCSLQEASEESHLMVFISFSVPVESWKDLSLQLEKTEGRFLLRGLPGNSFEELTKKIFEMRAAGVNAPIDIDPDRFEKYGIDAVPAIVLENGETFDRIVGNIRLDAALRLFAESLEGSS